MPRPYIFIVSETEPTSRKNSSALYAIDARTGKTRWTYPLDIWISGELTPVVEKGTVFVKSLPLKATTGADLGELEISGSVVSQGVVFAAERGGVRAVRANSGEELWRVPSSVSLEIGSITLRCHPAVWEGLMYVGGNGMYALDAATGSPAWSFRTPRKFRRRSLIRRSLGGGPMRSVTQP